MRFIEASQVRQSAKTEGVTLGNLLTDDRVPYQFGYLKGYGILWLDQSGREIEDDTREFSLAQSFLREELDGVLPAGEPSAAVEEPVAAEPEQESLRIFKANAGPWPHSARTQKRIGIAHASFETTLRASDPKKTCIFAVQDDGFMQGKEAQLTDVEIGRRRMFDKRAMVVVVGGDVEFQRKFLAECEEADHLVFVGTEEQLEQLGVKVADVDVMKPKLIDDYLLAKRPRKQQKTQVFKQTQERPTARRAKPVSRPKTVTRSVAADMDISIPEPEEPEEPSLEVDDDEMAIHAEQLLRNSI